jgi:hypothetical protein
MLITRKAAACADFGTGHMSAVELKAFLAAMEIARQANTAALALDLTDKDDGHSDQPVLTHLPVSRTVH